MSVAKFFEYARKRQQITIDRAAGKPQPWTRDKILQKYRFCSVFREDDKTTKWFADHVREPMNKKRDGRIMLATVLFRMFNRIETGEAMFCDDDLLGGHSAFDQFSETGDTRPLRRAILSRIGKRGPFVTGSYIISAPPGYSKLDGVLAVVKRFYRGQEEWQGLGAGVIDTMGWGGDEGATALLAAGPGEYTLEATWEWLRRFDYLGTFHSYEIVTDLRHTYLLDRAPDIMTWCNPGPGCRRGLNRVAGRWKGEPFDSRDDILDQMQSLLRKSRIESFWPKKWPKWEMRDVEHTLCEFDKYERTRLGEGRPRGVFSKR
jgi:hypothetical protein